MSQSVEQQTPSAATVPDNPYLQGNFAPVAREVSLGELDVRGALPPELAGVLMRNGPNPVGAQPGKHHWFVGDGMLHAIEIRGGRALGYRNRFVRTQRIESALGLPAAPASPYAPFNQASGGVNVIRHAGRVLALGEAGLPYEMDREANTQRQYDFDGKLRHSMTAHPKLDPVTGELFFFGYDIDAVPVRYYVADAQGRLVRELEIKTKQPAMMHDFGVTETRVVFMDLPVVFDMDLVARGLTMPFRWDASYGARLGVMRRDGDGSDLRWFEIPLCYVYHPFNAYDDGDQIVMDVVEHARTFAASELGPEDSSPPRFVRWQIDPERGQLTRTVIDENGQEFPRIDPRLTARRHRYGYSVEARWNPGVGFGGLIKHDMLRGTREVHAVPHHCSASEGVFVPIGRGEDEGYVLAPVYDASRGTSEIRVIDAQHFGAAPVATIELPVRIPFGFHGDFFAD
jgi:carotenoid cleavage dioxygenase